MSARILGPLLSCICALLVAQGVAAQARRGHFDDIGRILCAEGAAASRQAPAVARNCSGSRSNA